MYDDNLKARGKSLEDLMGLMDEGEAKRIPQVAQKIELPGVTITIEPNDNQPGDEQEQPGAPDPSPEHEMMESPEMEQTEHETGMEMQDEPVMGAGGQNPFEALIAKKKKEKLGMR